MRRSEIEAALKARVEAGEEFPTLEDRGSVWALDGGGGLVTIARGSILTDTEEAPVG